MTTDDTQERPAELEEHLDNLMEGGAEPPTGSGSGVSTNPNDTPAEHEPLAVADSDHDQDPGRDQAGAPS